MPRKFREKEKTLRIVPFSQQLHIVVSTDIREAYRKRNLGFSDDVTETCEAFVWSSEKTNHIFMFLPERAPLAHVVHESIHVVAAVMRQNGVKFEEEVWAYHMDEMFDIIAKFLYPPRKKKKYDKLSKKTA